MQEKRQIAGLFSIPCNANSAGWASMQEALNFPGVASSPTGLIGLAPGAGVLRQFAAASAESLLGAIQGVLVHSPLRRMVTPGGSMMSVRMSNCGALGWISDRRGYRYADIDPLSDRTWPAMPIEFVELASAAAARLGFDGFLPDACLINAYEPGMKLSLHQDRDERDLSAPIVSVSLGIPAQFQFGGDKRGDPVQRMPLGHGDVVVWGGPSRLRYHGVLPIKEGEHALTGRLRYNLTLRKAG
jgi:alkylated DNA repair protein (DNA oxidative demethylase)